MCFQQPSLLRSANLDSSASEYAGTDKISGVLPWVLSFVWRWNPEFPSNLDQAVALSGFFACFALWACYRLIRRLGAGRGLSLAITAFCGLHPVFLQIGSRIMTDVPMMGLSFVSLTLLEASVKKRAPVWLGP